MSSHVSFNKRITNKRFFLITTKLRCETQTLTSSKTRLRFTYLIHHQTNLRRRLMYTDPSFETKKMPTNKILYGQVNSPSVNLKLKQFVQHKQNLPEWTKIGSSKFPHNNEVALFQPQLWLVASLLCLFSYMT